MIPDRSLTRMRDRQRAEKVEGGRADGQVEAVRAVEQHIVADAQLDIAVGAEVGRVVRRVVDPPQVRGLKDDRHRSPPSPDASELSSTAARCSDELL